jgi:crotonobetainyl-CoA:carnitine CoA-transferase CaiB-like acyl-CoA transferase
MYEICVQQTYEAIVRTQCGERVQRMGNQDLGTYHQGVYPVAGVDQWIAISCESPADWRRFLDLAGLADPADPDSRDALIARWSGDQSGPALVDRLQAHRIAAGVVQDIEDLLEHDPQIAFRQSLIPLSHALLGTFGHMRTPITFSRSAALPYPPPAIGEHSLDIARVLAGLPAPRLQLLNKQGVFR